MFYIFLTLSICSTDWILKKKAQAYPDSLLPQKRLGGLVIQRKSHNPGMFMGLFSKNKKAVRYLTALCFLLLSVTGLPLLFKKGRRGLKLSISFLLGGALSNVAEHFLRGHVTDYFSPNLGCLRRVVFNVGDFFIFLGALLAAVFSR